MITLLRKIFIKNYKNINNPKVREKHGILASSVGISINFALFLIKILIGATTHSISIITDALNNISDSASSVISLVSIKLSSKPADKEHPFGHQRIEYISGLIIAFIILALAIIMGYSAIMKIINKTNDTSYDYISFIILGIGVAFKLCLGIFYRKMSKLIKSASLEAASQDTINDIITSSLVLGGVILQFLLDKYVPASREKLYLIDGIIGASTSLFVIIVGCKLVIDICNPLIGEPTDSKVIDKIISEIKANKNVLGTHDLIVHSYGPTTLFMTLHVEVDSKKDLIESHDLIDNIEKSIKEKYNVQLTIHMDPLEVGSPEIEEIKKDLNQIFKLRYDNKVSFHDLRLVKGITHDNVIMDVVIPFETNINEEQLKKFILRRLKQISPRYCAVITIEKA